MYERSFCNEIRRKRGLVSISCHAIDSTALKEILKGLLVIEGMLVNCGDSSRRGGGVGEGVKEGRGGGKMRCVGGDGERKRKRRQAPGIILASASARKKRAPRSFWEICSNLFKFDVSSRGGGEGEVTEKSPSQVDERSHPNENTTFLVTYPSTSTNPTSIPRRSHKESKLRFKRWEKELLVDVQVLV